jgi:hypothetical protein
MALALRSAPLTAPPVPDRRPHLTAVPARHPAGPVPAGPPTPAPPADASVRVLHPPVDGGPAAPLRLTRRGVVVVSSLVAVLCAGLVAVAAWSAATARAAGQPRPVTSSVVTVRPGDSLWSIAARVAPNADPRAEVEVLQRVNQLHTTRLVPGQRLQLG